MSAVDPKRLSLLVPSLLLFLGGIATGFALFPYVVPHAPTKQMARPLNPAPKLSAPQPISKPREEEQIFPLPLAAAPSTRDETLLQLFSPTAAEINSMQQETSEQKLLEQTLMIAFLLSNCKHLSPQEYQDIYSTLVKYVTSQGTYDPQTVVREAAERAKASYLLVYKNVPCDDASLPELKTSLLAWQKNALAGQAQR